MKQEATIYLWIIFYVQKVFRWKLNEASSWVGVFCTFENKNDHLVLFPARKDRNDSVLALYKTEHFLLQIFLISQKFFWMGSVRKRTQIHQIWMQFKSLGLCQIRETPAFHLKWYSLLLWFSWESCSKLSTENLFPVFSLRFWLLTGRKPKTSINMNTYVSELINRHNYEPDVFQQGFKENFSLRKKHL